MTDHSVPEEPIRRPIGLRFSLGDKVIYTRTYRGLVYKTPYFGAAPIAGEGAAARLLEDRSVDAILVRYCPTQGEIARFSRRPGLLQYVPETYHRYVISLAGGFDDYLKSLSSNTRSNIKRKVRKMAEHSGGECRFRVFSAPGEMPDFHAAASRVADRTYQKNLLGIRIPAEKDLVEAASRQAVLGFVLFHDDRPVAYLLCPIEGDVIRYEYVGYDPDFSEWSVGLVTQYLAIEKAFGMGRFRLWDFGQGEGQHKQVFANSSQHCSDRYFLRPTIGNRLAIRAHGAARDLNAVLRRLLEKLDLKATIKRKLRRLSGA